MSLQKSENLKTPFKALFRKSHRTLVEQIVGLLIFVVLGMMAWTTLQWVSAPFEHTFSAIWMLPSLIFGNITLLPYFFMGVGTWSLWRLFSIRKLKLEIALFLIQITLAILWHVFFLLIQETLMALFMMLLLLCSSIISTYVFWKKDRLSCLFNIPFLVWIAYAVSLNMLISLNP